MPESLATVISLWSPLSLKESKHYVKKAGYLEKADGISTITCIHSSYADASLNIFLEIQTLSHS